MPRGRPRRPDAPRGASGRILSSFYEETQAQRLAREERDARRMARWAWACEVVDHLKDDTRLESPLGRMLLIGKPVKIGRAQYEAGEWLAELLRDYDRLVLGGVRRTAAAQDVDKQPGRGHALEAHPEHVERLKRTLAHAEGVVIKAAPNGRRAAVLEALKDLVRGARVPSLVEAGDVAAALAAVAKDQGMDGEKYDGRMRRAGATLEFTPEDRTRAFTIVRS